MSTSAGLGNLLRVTADLNYYTMLLNQWASKYEANSEKLQKQCNLEEKWTKAYEDGLDPERDISASHGGVTVKIQAHQGNETLAEQYADAKVWQFDEDLSAELAELDIDYDSFKTMYETLVTQLQAEKDADKQQVASSAQDTHTLQGG